MQNRRTIWPLAQGLVAGALSLWLVTGSILSVSLAHVQAHHSHSHAHKGHDHAPADAPHTCALCVLAHGQVDIADPAPTLGVVPSLSTLAVPPALSPILPAMDYLRLPERAPPVAFILG
ncbi:MAG: DUF2946 family protein [Verrucomicrobiota bacterium]